MTWDGPLSTTGMAGAELALLLLGHMLADFVFQTAKMVKAKETWRGLLAHGALVLACQVVIFVPYLTFTSAMVLLAVALLHVVIDAAKMRWQPKQASIGPFLLDQAAHVVVLYIAWRTIVNWGLDSRPLLFQGTLSSDWVPHATHAQLAAGALILAGLAFNIYGSSTVVRLLLAAVDWKPTPRPDEETPQDRKGWLIGCLERLLVFILVLIGQWQAVGFVLTAKSIARFKDIENNRAFAEYYLVGTLSSILLAIVTGLLVKLLIGI